MRFDTYELPTAPLNPGRTIFLLGTSLDGPINSPVPVRNLADAETIFGPKDRGDLVKAYERTSLVTGNTVYLMRVTGEYARGSLLGITDDGVKPVIKIRSISGGSIYNSIHLYIDSITIGSVTKQALIVELPSSKMPSMAYALDKYDNIQGLLADINGDTRVSNNLIYATSEYPMLPISCLNTYNLVPTPIIGGKDGLMESRAALGLSPEVSYDDLYIALESSYRMLEGRDIDIICPVSARFDDTHPIHFYGGSSYNGIPYSSGSYLTLVDTENDDAIVTFHEQLIEFCRGQERFGMMTHGVIGLRELGDLTGVGSYNYAYILRLMETTAFKDRTGLVEFTDGMWVDKGYFITVFAGDLVFNKGTADEYYANGCDVYAGMLASIANDETTTNRPLPPNVNLRFEMDSVELKQLAVLGVTAFRNSVSQGPVISNGVTASLVQSVLHYIPNVRMVQLAMRAVNGSIEDLIGDNFRPIISENQMKRRIGGVLSNLKTQGLLKDYNFDVSLSQATGTGIVTINALPKYSTEFISAGANIIFTGTKGGA
jgi:hypothetical protein